MVTKKQARAGIKAGGSKAGIKIIPMVNVASSEREADKKQGILLEEYNINTYASPVRPTETLRKGKTAYALEPVTQADMNRAMKIRKKQRK